MSAKAGTLPSLAAIVYEASCLSGLGPTLPSWPKEGGSVDWFPRGLEGLS